MDGEFFDQESFIIYIPQVSDQMHWLKFCYYDAVTKVCNK